MEGKDRGLVGSYKRVDTKKQRNEFDEDSQSQKHSEEKKEILLTSFSELLETDMVVGKPDVPVLSPAEIAEESATASKYFREKLKQIDFEGLSIDLNKREQELRILQKDLKSNKKALKDLTREIETKNAEDLSNFIPKIDEVKQSEIQNLKKSILDQINQHRRRYEDFQNYTGEDDLIKEVDERKEKIKIYNDVTAKLDEYITSMSSIIKSDVSENLIENFTEVAKPDYTQITAKIESQNPIGSPDTSTEQPERESSHTSKKSKFLTKRGPKHDNSDNDQYPSGPGQPEHNWAATEQDQKFEIQTVGSPLTSPQDEFAKIEYDDQETQELCTGASELVKKAEVSVTGVVLKVQQLNKWLEGALNQVAEEVDQEMKSQEEPVEEVEEDETEEVTEEVTEEDYTVV